MLAFSLSGTYVVDLKDTSTQSRVSSKLQADFLSNFFANMIKMQNANPIENDNGYSQSRDEFQKCISLELFNLNVSSNFENHTFVIGEHRVQQRVRSGNNCLEASGC